MNDYTCIITEAYRSYTDTLHGKKYGESVSNYETTFGHSVQSQFFDFSPQIWRKAKVHNARVTVTKAKDEGKGKMECGTIYA